jgi:hypothetical protein
MSTRRCIDDGDAPVSAPDGRWGRRRVRTDECDLVLTVEYVYTDLVRVGKDIRPGTTFDGVATVGNRGIPVRVEVRANRVWPNGRLFFVCAPCGRRCTRLYVPVLSKCASACRRCWGLSYRAQTSRNYKDSGPIVCGFRLIHRMVARFQGSRMSRQRAKASRQRQAERRRLRQRLRD